MEAFDLGRIAPQLQLPLPFRLLPGFVEFLVVPPLEVGRHGCEMLLGLGRRQPRLLGERSQADDLGLVGQVAEQTLEEAVRTDVAQDPLIVRNQHGPVVLGRLVRVALREFNDLLRCPAQFPQTLADVLREKCALRIAGVDRIDLPPDVAQTAGEERHRVGGGEKIALRCLEALVELDLLVVPEAAGVV